MFLGSPVIIHHTCCRARQAQPKQRGLSQSQQSTLEVCIVSAKSAPASPASGLAVCTICLEHMVPGDEFFKLGCEHQLHRKCMERWFEFSSKCPSCRQEVLSDGCAAGGEATAGEAGAES